ncbi:ATP-binding mismatch repair protein [Globomyces sp. JEL0801]|nr:ATP-binding mismatch repair protein [Globomyces sp. JEL0801]
MPSERNVTPDKRTLILQLEEELVNSVSEELKSIFEPFRGVFQTKKSVTGQPVPKNKSTFLQHTIPKIIDNSKFSDQSKKRIMTNHPKSIEVDLNVIRSQLEASTSSKHAQFKVDYSEGDILNQTISITKDKFKAMKIHGQFNLGFILASLDDHLFIIDQHARLIGFELEKLHEVWYLKTVPHVRDQILEISGLDGDD